jgi:hypothetical protein
VTEPRDPAVSLARKQLRGADPNGHSRRTRHHPRAPHIGIIALVTAGVEMDVLGIAFSEFTEAERMTEEIMDERETSSRAIGGAPNPAGKGNHNAKVWG